MDKKLEARIARLERMISRKRKNEGWEDFEREMTALLNKYNAVIERSPDGGVWAVEDAPDGVVLMTFEWV